MWAGIVHVDAFYDEGDVDILAEKPDAAGTMQGNTVPNGLNAARAPFALHAVFSKKVGGVDGGIDLETLVTMNSSSQSLSGIADPFSVLHTVR